MENSLLAATGLAAVGIMFLLILYVWSTFSYSISHESLILRRTILGGLRFGRIAISLKDIAEVRRPHRRENLGAGFIFGNVHDPRVVVVVLRRRPAGLNFAKRVFLTPDDPPSFLADLKGKIDAVVSNRGDMRR